MGAHRVRSAMTAVAILLELEPVCCAEITQKQKLICHTLDADSLRGEEAAGRGKVAMPLDHATCAAVRLPGSLDVAGLLLNLLLSLHTLWAVPMKTRTVQLPTLNEPAAARVPAQGHSLKYWWRHCATAHSYCCNTQGCGLASGSQLTCRVGTTCTSSFSTSCCRCSSRCAWRALRTRQNWRCPRWPVCTSWCDACRCMQHSGMHACSTVSRSFVT